MSENVSLFRLNCNCPHIQAFQEGAFLAHRVIGSRTSSAGNTRAAWLCQVPLPGIGTDSTSACRQLGITPVPSTAILVLCTFVQNLRFWWLDKLDFHAQQFPWLYLLPSTEREEHIKPIRGVGVPICQRWVLIYSGSPTDFEIIKCHQSRWVVITTINTPTATIESLAKVGITKIWHTFQLYSLFSWFFLYFLEDWCMVLVFDKKTPESAFNNTKSSKVVGDNGDIML